MTRLPRIGAVALAAAAMTIAGLQAPAHAATAAVVVKLGARAHLSADGKTAKVKVTITCRNAGPAPIDVSVTQNRSNTIASGTGQTGSGYKCSGRAQSTVVAVTAKKGERFHTGGAAAKASVTLVDNGSGPASDSDARNISLT